MHPSAQQQIIRKLLAHVENKTTQLGARETAYPAAAYYNAERFADELTRVFRKYPLLVCHSAEIAAPGSCLVAEIAGLPLLVTRDAENQVHVMLNVCRHRGARLCDGAKKDLRNIQCPYHNWVYDLGGGLRGMPHKYGFDAANAERNLVKLPSAEYLGFVFAIPDTAAKMDMPGYFGPLHAELSAYAPALANLYGKRSFTGKLNWKLVLDLFLEVYHVKSVHKNSIASIFHDNVYLYERFGLHMRTVNPKYRVDKLRNIPPNQWNIRKVANVEYVLFPNTIVLIEPNHIDFLVVLPETPDTCRLDLYALTTRPARTNLHERAYKESADLVQKAILEDVAIGEGIQSGLRAGANTHLAFGRFEEAADIFHKILDEQLA